LPLLPLVLLRLVMRVPPLVLVILKGWYDDKGMGSDDGVPA